ncbi:methyltransferase [Seongchinamella sediminis]|uniref:Methyltransferase n=1 Tax=Seongchinamella sediminis TaxID=2283635 RepID=A0A3L7E468_9GAMM|nr:class I SAM-dependent methyltransferase [Seongchinamella sediminis]RLQ23333.1 methyltransferase [Seongchinamella sediminis]
MHALTKTLAAAGLALASALSLADSAAHNPALVAAVEARGEQDRARDAARHPVETLSFFQVEPGMTVAEGLPGGGWYSHILANYLGSEGTLYGVNYPARIWALFANRSDEWRQARAAATGKFSAMVAGFTDNGISTDGFTFNTVPPQVAGTVDRVLLIRALHNLNRFDAQSGLLSQALAAVRGMLKEDGLVGIVQHRLPESAPEAGADGNRGYLKESTVIAAMEKAGFELLARSEINANPKDQPGPNDIVWRLPPSLAGSEDQPEQRAAMLAIGESDRMTLLFRKAGKP